MYNINPLLWGPHLWKFMHYLTLSYPDNPDIAEQNKFRNFFMMIGQYLPCEKCRVNYKTNIQTLPLTDVVLSSRNNLIKWLFDLHNIVNKETGKTQITYDKFNDIYINNKQDDNDNIQYKYGMLIILAVILIILFIIYKKSYSK
jgi:hypothetical protein